MDYPVFKKRNVVYRRVAELLLPTIFCSLLITIFNITGIVVNRINIFFMISAFVLAFTIFNFHNLRNCYFDLRNKKLFFMLNFLSYAIFAGVNFAVLLLFNSEIYTWLFAITKGLRFLYIDLIYSVLFFHFIQLACILVSTIGMEWIFYEAEEIESGRGETDSQENENSSENQEKDSDSPQDKN